MKALVVVCVAMAAASLVHVATAADYVVGDPAGGWDGRTDYKSWAAAQTFAPGDTLTFKYNSFHNVLEVTKDAYDACDTASPITSDSSGSTTVALTVPGARYFICGAPGHCQRGMKMEVVVADRPAPTTPSSPPTLPPSSSSGHEKRRPGAPAPTPAWAPAIAPAPPRRRGGHRQHRKGYCPPGVAARAPAPAPTVLAVEADFPVAAFAPMSSPPPPPPSTSAGSSAMARAKWGEVTVALAAVGGLMLLAM